MGGFKSSIVMSGTFVIPWLQPSGRECGVGAEGAEKSLAIFDAKRRKNRIILHK
jgi:hypothetical protein